MSSLSSRNLCHNNRSLERDTQSVFMRMHFTHGQCTSLCKSSIAFSHWIGNHLTLYITWKQIPGGIPSKRYEWQIRPIRCSQTYSGDFNKFPCGDNQFLNSSCEEISNSGMYPINEQPTGQESCPFVPALWIKSDYRTIVHIETIWMQMRS
jgi:hypothetical protein